MEDIGEIFDGKPTSTSGIQMVGDGYGAEHGPGGGGGAHAQPGWLASRDGLSLPGADLG